MIVLSEDEDLDHQGGVRELENGKGLMFQGGFQVEILRGGEDGWSD